MYVPIYARPYIFIQLSATLKVQFLGSIYAAEFLWTGGLPKNMTCV